MIYRIQPETLSVNGKIVTLLGGEIANAGDLSDREIGGVRKFLLTEKLSDMPFMPYFIEAARAYDVPVSSVLSKSQSQPTCEARQYAWHLIKEHLKRTPDEEIGIFTGHEHSTVLHGRKLIKTLLATNQMKWKRR